MRRRSAFTLVEMMVAVALILFIMVILTEAFGKSIQAFRDLKAVGDMEERLRNVAATLRRDLAADHFEGRRRLSDGPRSWAGPDEPREGFFRIAVRGASSGSEGQDPNGISSRRRTNRVLHFSVKLRGNDRKDFFTANLPAVPPESPLRTQPTTFFGHPRDARHSETENTYNSQWAEVAYYLDPNPTGQTPGGTLLYALYRTQLVVVADNRALGEISRTQWGLYPELSCQPDFGNVLHFNTPADLAVGPTYRYPSWLRPARPGDWRRRSFNPLLPTRRGASLLLTDVLSFDVQSLEPANNLFQDSVFDTARGRIVVRALRIQVRVWDAKTRQSRQITLIQDM